MEKAIYAIIVALLAAGLVFYILSDCSADAYEVSITQMTDHTGSYPPLKADTEGVKKMLSIEDDRWGGYHFRLLIISEIDYTEAYEADIKPVCEAQANAYERKRKIATFNKKVEDILLKDEKKPYNKQESSIYLPLVVEMKRLMSRNAGRRVLIAYTDLIEKSSVMNWYNKKQLKTLEENPDSTAKMLQKQAEIPDLSGLEIHFIYQPVSIEENNRYRIISNFYKGLLESKGAAVEIQANIPY